MTTTPIIPKTKPCPDCGNPAYSIGGECQTCRGSEFGEVPNPVEDMTPQARREAAALAMGCTDLRWEDGELWCTDPTGDHADIPAPDPDNDANAMLALFIHVYTLARDEVADRMASEWTYAAHENSEPSGLRKQVTTAALKAAQEMELG